MSGSRDHIKLTKKQEDFCQAYVDSGNASDAYRESYNVSRMKTETINRSASELLKNHKITTRIEQLQQNLRKVSNIQRERLLYELFAMATSSIPDYGQFTRKTQSFTIKNFNSLTDMQKRAIQSMTPTKYGYSIKLHSKESAIEKIIRMLGYEAPRKFDQNFRFEGLTDEQLDQILDWLKENHENGKFQEKKD
ncbi:terminase small subunit [Bacteroidota bacterium]